MIHASMKNLRSTLLAFPLNKIDSIPILFKGHLPMSPILLVPFLAIMDIVNLRHSKAEDHFVFGKEACDLLS